MAQVVLVRHAMPGTQPDVPAERWRLGDDGRAAARRLAGALPRAPFALTSDEPKAQQTAQELIAVCGGTLAVDARVAETRRPHVWDASFRELARQYVAGHQHSGWEPHDAVVGRSDAAVRAGLGASHGAPLVVVTHGQALTLWLRSVGAIDDAPRFWSELDFPDASTVTVRWSEGAAGGRRAGTTPSHPTHELMFVSWSGSGWRSGWRAGTRSKRSRARSGATHRPCRIGRESTA
jgi:broad specificity phosphatase PhoE